MLSKNLQKEVASLNEVVDKIYDVDDRYSIFIMTSTAQAVFIGIENSDTHYLIGKMFIPVSHEEYIPLVNTLRTMFVDKGVLVSKLNRAHETSNLKYVSQELFVKNLSMKISINSEIEQLEAMKSHAMVLSPIEAAQKKLQLKI
ncbi:MAG: hypothetical protein E7173_00065 [Firmicutes bacterium]|nr:hypothetical protein [Bacillota bacterium]